MSLFDFVYPFRLSEVAVECVDDVEEDEMD